jgi:hypothetical protein
VKRVRIIKTWRDLSTISPRFHLKPDSFPDRNLLDFKAELTLPVLFDKMRPGHTHVVTH